MTISVLEFGAVGNGSGDDTQTIQSALDSQYNVIVIPAGRTFCVSSLRLPPNKTMLLGGTLSLIDASGTSPIVEISSGSRILGNFTGRITGNNLGMKSAIATSNASNVVIDGISIDNINGGGIVNYQSGRDWVVKNCRIYNVKGHAIAPEYVSNLLIADNIVNTALHGIMWYGGDAAITSQRKVENIRISGNSVANVMGGIWGTLGSHISIVNNHVIYCSDVGIDFEGCSLFTATGNTAAECKNGCYAVFYSSERGVITGNTGLNYSYPASCYYNHRNTSKLMTVQNNAFNR